MPDRNREAWNDEDIAMLRGMSAEGATIERIARELGRTQAATETKMYKLKLPVKR